MKRFAVISKAIRTAAFLLLAPAIAVAAECKNVEFEDQSYSVCEANPATETIRLYLNDNDGVPLGSFSALERTIKGKSLRFAMNAGMYHPDRSPVGLYIENGKTLRNIVTRDGPGNFGLLPNGVLCLSAVDASVVESKKFATDPPDCQYATQSGPMLVLNGDLHPRFIPNSPSKYVRNGVGIREDGILIAAISNAPVNFHTFGRLFRDVLKTPNALFLDGNISRLYAPDLNRNDIGLPLGPMIGVIASDN